MLPSAALQKKARCAAPEPLVTWAQKQWAELCRKGDFIAPVCSPGTISSWEKAAPAGKSQPGTEDKARIISPIYSPMFWGFWLMGRESCSARAALQRTSLLPQVGLGKLKKSDGVTQKFSKFMDSCIIWMLCCLCMSEWWEIEMGSKIVKDIFLGG